MVNRTHANTMADITKDKRNCALPMEKYAANAAKRPGSSSLLEKYRSGETRIKAKRDFSNAIHESEMEDSDSDTYQEIDFMDESARHLADGKVKISRVTIMKKPIPLH